MRTIITRVVREEALLASSVRLVLVREVSIEF